MKGRDNFKYKSTKPQENLRPKHSHSCKGGRGFSKMNSTASYFASCPQPKTLQVFPLPFQSLHTHEAMNRGWAQSQTIQEPLLIFLIASQEEPVLHFDSPKRGLCQPLTSWTTYVFLHSTLQEEQSVENQISAFPLPRQRTRLRACASTKPLVYI